ncbi:ribosome maturation factor RimM [Sporolactobacillus spathodeae]|uniref:Ribosome maturation factor RimM n=1 Tax=Sporolactobacillus spathodeae TaxID=1465502 RepID=A0ABS2QBM9_9BACL|nr:ribosome maturation factor RimM [Sporolactobacillus spathodeae]MBM7659212.1 16S rRNA processing protein RimM [Sporolactobacillus spathodeae]
MTDWYYVGKIVNTRGIKGEVKVISETDFPEQRFANGAILYAEDPKTHRRQPLTVTGFQSRKPFVCLTFAEYDSINEVEKFKGHSLFVPHDQLQALGNDEFYYHEIIGADVYTEDGRLLGSVKEILSPGANDVWVVKTSGKDILLPYIKDVVKTIDVAKRKIIVHLIPGLIDDEN